MTAKIHPQDFKNNYYHRAWIRLSKSTDLQVTGRSTFQSEKVLRRDHRLEKYREKPANQPSQKPENQASSLLISPLPHLFCPKHSVSQPTPNQVPDPALYIFKSLEKKASRAVFTSGACCGVCEEHLDKRQAQQLNQGFQRLSVWRFLSTFQGLPKSIPL